MAPGSHSTKTALLAALGLGLALGYGPVHADSSRFAVSATILTTNACHFTGGATGTASPKLFGCTGPGSFKTHHMRVTRAPDTSANAAPGRYARTVLLTLEP